MPRIQRLLSTIFLLVLFANASRANGVVIPEDVSETEDVLVDCIANIIKTNFVNKPSILISESKPENSTPDIFYERLTTHLTNNFIPKILGENFINKNPKYAQDTYILFIKYFNDCERISNLLSKPVNEALKYLIVISDLSHENCDAIFENVGKTMSKYDITYVTKRRDEIEYKIVTFIPQMNATSCVVQFDLPLTVLSDCNLKESVNVFPLKKPQDLMQCPFKVGFASLYPYNTIQNYTTLNTLDPLNETQGLDYEIIKIMAEYFNFTMEMYVIARKEDNAFEHNRFISYLINGTLDICAGGMYRVYGDIVEYSGVYNRQGIMWVFTVNRIKRSWQNLISKINGMYIFIIFYVCYTTICYLFCLYDKRGIPVSDMLLHSWGALIGTSSLHQAMTLKQRILNIFYLVLCLHLTAYISVQMYSFLTIMDPAVTYKTNDDLVVSETKPFLARNLKHFMKDSGYGSFANKSGECRGFEDCMEKVLQHDGPSGTVLLEGLLTLYQANTVVNDETRVLKVPENLLTTYHELLLRKNSTITRNFQKVLRRLCEAGICDRLYYEALGLLTLAKAEIGEKNIMSYSYSCEYGCSITLKQIVGQFYLWFFGCVMSFCAFVAEVLSKRERL